MGFAWLNRRGRKVRLQGQHVRQLFSKSHPYGAQGRFRAIIKVLGKERQEGSAEGRGEAQEREESDEKGAAVGVTAIRMALKRRVGRG